MGSVGLLTVEATRVSAALKTKGYTELISTAMCHYVGDGTCHVHLAHVEEHAQVLLWRLSQRPTLNQCRLGSVGT